MSCHSSQVCAALLGSQTRRRLSAARGGGREERAQAELAAHNQLVTQLTLLHHQVRSQNIVQPGYFVPRNVLADAYYTPVRCGPVCFALQRAERAGESVAASSLLCSAFQCDAPAKCFPACTVPRAGAYPVPPLCQIGRQLPGMGTGMAQAG